MSAGPAAPARSRPRVWLISTIDVMTSRTCTSLTLPSFLERRHQPCADNRRERHAGRRSPAATPGRGTVMRAGDPSVSTYTCTICDYHTERPDPAQLGTARGNTERFRQQRFHLWQCPQCRSIFNTDPADFADIYREYPLNNRRLDIFARGTLRNLLKRLTSAGLMKSHSILDVGCGANAVLIQFLQERGFGDVTGFDPYTEQYRVHPAPRQFDCVIVNDVIEHVPAPRQFAVECAALVKPGGLL